MTAKRNQPGVRTEHRTSRGELVARVTILPTFGAATTIQRFAPKDDPPELHTLAMELADQTRKIVAGDLSGAEATLSAQAATLDVIFNRLASLAAGNLFDSFDGAERLLRLALKTQSQSRATIETLALMKNPAPAIFATQANIAQAVQVNNGIPPPGATPPAHAGKRKPVQNELLTGEVKDGSTLDCGGAGTAGCADTILGTVEAIQRPSNS